MISIDRLKAVTDIYCHASCPDGTSSAMICAAAYSLIGMKPKVWFIQHNTEKLNTLEARPGQLFVDITPPPNRWEEWKEVSPIVLDHHNTCKHITESLEGIYGDSTMSGASLAFEHVMGPIQNDYWNEISRLDTMRDLLQESNSDIVKPIIDEYWSEISRLAAIRDTWQESHSDWYLALGLANEIMDDNPYNWVDAARNGTLDFKALQKAAIRGGEKIDAKSQKVAKNAYFQTIHIQGVPYLLSAFNNTENITSEIANLLLKYGSDISVGYFFICEDGGPKAIVSLRTKGEINARRIAEHMKGGGHDKAAGFPIYSSLDISLNRIVQIVSHALYDLAKVEGTIQPDDGRPRFTKEQVLESLKALHKERS